MGILQSRKQASIEEQKEAQKQFTQNIQMQKQQLEKQIEELQAKDTVKLDLWLSVLSGTLNVDALQFKSLQTGIQNSAALYDLFNDLRDLGITKIEEFENEIGELLRLFQKQWELLQNTVMTLTDLADKCVDCEWAIEAWKREMCQTNGQQKPNPNMEKIAKHISEINSWLDNKKIVEELLKKWSKFKVEAQNFTVQWDRISGTVTGEVKKELDKRCETMYKTFWQRHKQKFYFAGGTGLGYAIAHVGVIVGGVACTATGILAGVVIVGGLLAYAVHKWYQNNKMDSVQNADHKLIESIDEMTNKLTQMVKDSEFIEQICHELQAGVTTQANGMKRISKYWDPTTLMWEAIERQLNELDKSLKEFRGKCNKTTTYIVDTQRRMAGVGKKK